MGSFKIIFDISSCCLKRCSLYFCKLLFHPVVSLNSHHVSHCLLGLANRHCQLPWHVAICSCQGRDRCRLLLGLQVICVPDGFSQNSQTQKCVPPTAPATVEQAHDDPCSLQVTPHWLCGTTLSPSQRRW